MSRTQKEVDLNYHELTPAQYGRSLSPPVSAATIVNRCNQGLLKAYRTQGGHWKIKIPINALVTVEDFEKVRSENIKLKTTVDNIKHIINSI